MTVTAQVATALAGALDALFYVVPAMPLRAGSIDLVGVAAAIVDLAVVATATVTLEEIGDAELELTGVAHTVERPELVGVASGDLVLV